VYPFGSVVAPDDIKGMIASFLPSPFVDAICSDPRTPLMLARDSLKKVKVLIENGADPTITAPYNRLGRYDRIQCTALDMLQHDIAGNSGRYQYDHRNLAPWELKRRKDDLEVLRYLQSVMPCYPNKFSVGDRVVVRFADQFCDQHIGVIQKRTANGYNILFDGDEETDPDEYQNADETVISLLTRSVRATGYRARTRQAWRNFR